MAKVGLTVLSAALLLCSGCANSGGIRYGSTIEIDAGSDRANGARKVKVDGAGLFFSGKFGRIGLGQEGGPEKVTSGSERHTVV
jgi:hypothetical protein